MASQPWVTLRNYRRPRIPRCRSIHPDSSPDTAGEVTVTPPETDPPLLVDPYAVLALPIAFQSLKLILEAYRQGRMEAIAQLGAYTLCLAAFVGSALGLVRLLPHL